MSTILIRTLMIVVVSHFSAFASAPTILVEDLRLEGVVIDVVAFDITLGEDSYVTVTLKDTGSRTYVFLDDSSSAGITLTFLHGEDLKPKVTTNAWSEGSRKHTDLTPGNALTRKIGLREYFGPDQRLSSPWINATAIRVGWNPPALYLIHEEAVLAAKEAKMSLLMLAASKGSWLQIADDARPKPSESPRLTESRNPSGPQVPPPSLPALQPDSTRQPQDVAVSSNKSDGVSASPVSGSVVAALVVVTAIGLLFLVIKRQKG